MEAKVTGGIETFTGKIVSPLWTNPDAIDIRDIAHGLSFMPRFAGQSKVFYSAGQHSLIMAKWFKRRGMMLEAKYALIHEGAEGLGMMDMPTPIKYLPEMSAYKTIESDFQYAIYKKFGLYDKPPEIVKELDKRMFFAERKVLFDNNSDEVLNIDTSDLIIKPYKTFKTTETNFLKEFEILFGIDLTFKEI